jgi:AbrB family looped-hinge helix DNA binding protein
MRGNNYPPLTPLSRVRVDAAGRIVIPSDIRSRLAIEPGQDLILSERPDGLHVMTFRHLLAEAQTFFAPYAVPGQSIVDELIRERREEAKREENE